MEIVKHLQSATIVRELDLTELDPAYVSPDTGEPLRLLFRVNPSRGQVALQYALGYDYGEVQKEYERGDLAPEEQAALTARLKQLNLREYQWWATVLMVDEPAGPDWPWLWRLLGAFGVERKEKRRYMRPRELSAINEASHPVWVWLTTTVLARIRQFEAELIKKASGAPIPISTEQAEPRPQSTEG